MEQYKPTALKHRLFSTLITIGFIFLGGIVGVFVGALLYTYLIPFWNSTEIDVEGRNFTEIVLVESGFLENVHLSQDNVILKADDGNYYAYHQNKWQLTSLPEFDKTKFAYNAPPCSEWPGPPPAVYLHRTRSNVGVEFAHTLGYTSRCYILLADGRLQLWTRNYGVFEIMFMGAFSLVVGMIIGGIVGRKMARRKFPG